MTQESAPQIHDASSASQQADILSAAPSQLGGNLAANDPLKVRFETFEAARQTENLLSDSFIDGCLSSSLQVGAEPVLRIKSYLDKVEASAKDDEIINNPEAIADLYLSTTAMLARNLKILTLRHSDPVKDAEHKAVIKTAKDEFLAQLPAQANAAAAGLIDLCTGKTRWMSDSVKNALEYDGMRVNGVDPLDASNGSETAFRPNIKVQRQVTGTFIMAYSDKQVHEKLIKQDKPLSRRIYLNPEAAAVPGVFEQILQTANDSGLSIKLKMLQRAPEFTSAHLKQLKGIEKGGLRGDGIVIYADENEADSVLAMVLALAKDQPEAFVGRETSRIPQAVAEGIAIGDEPVQMSGESLTTHREKILDYATAYVEKSGKTGQEARDLFRRCLAATAKANKVNPDNLAFNTV